jgi:hypothetical protein
MSTITKAQIKGAIEIMKAVANAIKELGSIPSGHLYVHLNNSLTLDEYNRIIGLLKGAELITVGDDHLITWIGPTT